MRYLKLLTTVVAAVATISGCAHAASLERWTGGATPELRARTLDGDFLDLRAMRGRVVIVNFWATWCVPCVAEMPGLDRLRRKLHIEVVAVNFQENAARIRPFLAQTGVMLPVVRDHDGSLRSTWRVSVFPTTFVIAPDGRIVFVATGEVDWDDPMVQALVASEARTRT
jgi:thiol-disulfide isomerase/thioredoxin